MKTREYVGDSHVSREDALACGSPPMDAGRGQDRDYDYDYDYGCEDEQGRGARVGAGERPMIG